jgi:site-specific DNA recombinase
MATTAVDARPEGKPTGCRSVWGYLRCSTEDQARRTAFSTVDAQEELIRQYVQRKAADGLDWRIVRMVKDEGFSGEGTKRPGLERLMKAVDAGVVDVVIVYRLDRISRSVADFARMWERFEAAGVDFISTVEAYDSTTAMGRAMLMTSMVWAQLERETIGERTRDKMHAQAARGDYLGGSLPFGITLDDQKRRTPHPEYVPVIREAFRLADHRRSIAAVADFLNAATPSLPLLNGDREPRVWTVQTARLFLDQPLYKGVFVFNRYGGRKRSGRRPQLVTTVEDALPAIVSPDVWERVNGWLRQRAGMASRHCGPYRYLLRGKVFCGSCQSAMSPSSPGGKKAEFKYYRCARAGKKMTRCQPSHINADMLHEALLSEMSQEARDGNLATVLERVPDGMSEDRDMLLVSKSALEARVRELRHDITNLNDGIRRGFGSVSTARELRAAERDHEEASESLRRVEEALANSNDGMPDLAAVEEAWARLDEVWEELSDDERQAFFNETVERVDVVSDERLRVCFRFEIPASDVAPLDVDEDVGYDTIEASRSEPLGSRSHKDWLLGLDSNQRPAD